MSLFVVSTPIGNLDDLSDRAIRTLRECDLVAAEDTRHTGRLLAHLGLDKPMVAFYDEVEQERTPRLLDALARGESVALVSDAGTPAVSDPGHRLVRSALERGFRVVPIPGPSAVLAALVASGLPTDRFRFEGFVPRKRGQRSAFVEALADEPATTVAFESPKRLLKTLDALAEHLPDREIVVARELTKLHEEIIRGAAGEVAALLRGRDVIKGEVTLVIAGAGQPPEASDREVARVVGILQAHDLDPRTVRSIASELLGVPKSRLFEAQRQLSQRGQRGSKGRQGD